MKSETVKIFTAIEVTECFMDAYIKVYKMNMEVQGNAEEVLYVTKDYECIQTMFDALKIATLMQLPEQYKGEYSGYEKLKYYLDNLPSQYPNLLADIETAQQEVKKFQKQMNVVYYNNGYDVNVHPPKDHIPTTHRIMYGATVLMQNASTIIKEMENEEFKNSILKMVKMCL